MTTDAREWFSAAARRKVTATEIADHLGVARNTANKRLADGLSADDVVDISRALGLNPTESLVELGYLRLTEVMDYIDGDGKLLATADEHELLLELVDRSLSVSDLAGLLSRRTEARMGDGYRDLSDRAVDELARRRRATMSDTPDTFAASDRGPDSKAPDSHDLGEESQDPDDFA